MVRPLTAWCSSRPRLTSRGSVPRPCEVADLSQTTLPSTKRAPSSPTCATASSDITRPRSDDICYDVPPTARPPCGRWPSKCDLVLVIGSKNSSNSNRLVDVARDLGTPSYLIDGADQVQEEWLEGAEVVGISSGASAPEELVDRLVAFFRERGTQGRLRSSRSCARTCGSCGRSRSGRR